MKLCRKPKAAEAAADKKPSSVVREKGCVLRFVGIGEGKSREDIRDELQEFGSVAYVDFEQGLTEVGRERGEGKGREGSC